MLELTQVLSSYESCIILMICPLCPLSFLQEYWPLIVFPELMSRICEPFFNHKFKLITSVSEFGSNKRRTAGRVEITIISCHTTDWIYLLQCSRTAGTGIFDGFWLLLFVFSGPAWWWWSKIICTIQQLAGLSNEREWVNGWHTLKTIWKTRVVCIIGAFKRDRLSFCRDGSALFQQGLSFYNSFFLFAR